MHAQRYRTQFLWSSSGRALQNSLNAIARRFLSKDAPTQNSNTGQSDPVVITPKLPECGFAPVVIQILNLQGVPPENLKTYNTLEDSELLMVLLRNRPTMPQVYANGGLVGAPEVVISS
ncbi:hypothetical protein JB92DRAFT_2706736 [Gautieria morchelliformis]|nr:hypothetical protein JB92DRAFT_2706736 [Gautieria morchelliformis]